MARSASGGQDGDTRSFEDSSVETQRPSFYVVVVHNDPITPRGFVVSVLRRFFAKTEAEAVRIMKLAHNFGLGVVASYPFEIAETKASKVNQFARENGFPLSFSVERE